jgi:anthranilate synthase component II
MLLLIDNYDSFTYNLVHYFEQLGQKVDVIRNDVPITQIEWEKYNGLILSPGPETPEKANLLLQYIQYAVDKLPVLGICLGHQALNIHFGGSLKKALLPMHGKISLLYCKEDNFLSTLPSNFNVVRYHSLVIDQLASDLEVLATSRDQEIMIIKHKTLPILGIQYHPESILTQFGIEILHNWLKETRILI